MEQIPQYAESLGVVGCLLGAWLALHRGWVVLGREYLREVARGDKLEAALAESIAANRVADAANAKLAALVPDLMRELSEFRSSTPGDHRPD